jgi:Na+/proline symporter
MRIGVIVILFSFTFYIAAQFQAAGNTFAGALNMDPTPAIVLGAGIVLTYVMLGGFWAVSVTDSIQGILMAASAVILPIVALVAVGGHGVLLASLDVDGISAITLWTRQESLAVGIGFVIGLAGIGLGYLGQPHVVNRFMAMENLRDIPRNGPTHRDHMGRDYLHRHGSTRMVWTITGIGS